MLRKRKTVFVSALSGRGKGECEDKTGGFRPPAIEVSAKTAGFPWVDEAKHTDFRLVYILYTHPFRALYIIEFCLKEFHTLGICCTMLGKICRKFRFLYPRDPAYFLKFCFLLKTDVKCVI